MDRQLPAVVNPPPEQGPDPAESPAAGPTDFSPPASNSQLWLSGEQQKLHPSFVRMEILAGWIWAAVLTLGSGVGLGFLLLGGSLPGWGQASLLAAEVIFVGALCWGAQWWPAIDYRHRSYRVSDSGVQVRKGVLWRQEMDVPRARVQHMDVNQGPIERRFGLAHLVIHNAGTVSASVKLEGLGYDTAVAIRDHLISAARTAPRGPKGDEGDAV